MAAPRLEPDDFGRFFRAVHGEDPFPWQERLARRVFERGWPEGLDIPTGAGKTAAIDVAVFHLALEATKGSARCSPVRIVFVVDRRLVVDDAHARALKIKLALGQADSGLLLRVKDRLRLLAEEGAPPLVVSKLRGGAPREPDWVRSPSQPAVIVSTVDQVGSRLFFRGYGVSDSMKPVHAGLLGADALLLLDEAHLSQPFLRSVRDSRALQVEGPSSRDAAPAPFAVVTLSATPGQESERGVDLVKSDDRRHPVLGKRLSASKPVQLLAPDHSPDSKAWVDEVVSRAWSLSALDGGAAVATAIVVNRVARAREIHDAILRRLGRSTDQSALLIGPARPLERDARIRDLLPRLAARRPADADARPLIVVATQCIEAGADLDFDAMVSELAPLDCLRQRFGRLNRMGRPIDARGAVIAGAGLVGGRAEPDPIYGRSMAATWDLLSEKAETRGKGSEKGEWLDFGVEASREWLPEPERLRPCLAPREKAPVMMPAFVAQWSCTSPIPLADPDVALFLHGPKSGPADVQVVWRADLSEDDTSLWAERVSVCPPSALEAISIPLYAARAWLRQAEAPDIADAELAPTGEEHEGRTGNRGRPTLRWRGPDDASTRLVRVDEVRPGDTLVVPTQYGGCDEWGWSPSSREPVRKDLGGEANLAQRGIQVLRFAPEIVAQAWRETGLDEPTTVARAAGLRDLLMELRDRRSREASAALAASDLLPPAWREALSDKAGRLERYGAATVNQGIPLAFVRRLKPSTSSVPEETRSATTEDDRSSQSGSAVGLPAHSRGVRDLVEDSASRAGLSRGIASDLALAGLLHDAGKAHPDFKRWLYGGDEIAAAAGPDLAKSGRPLDGETRAFSGLPVGARHEVASVLYALAHPALGQASDPDLVLWLIGTHHGHGRPFFPPVPWPTPGSAFRSDIGEGGALSADSMGLAQLTARWCDLHSRLIRKYGPWGLARLEAVLRLADHRQSQLEEEEAP